MNEVLANLSGKFFGIAILVIFFGLLFWSFGIVSKYIKSIFKIQGFKVELFSVVFVFIALGLIFYFASKVSA